MFLRLVSILIAAAVGFDALSAGEYTEQRVLDRVSKNFFEFTFSPSGLVPASSMAKPPYKITIFDDDTYLLDGETWSGDHGIFSGLAPGMFQKVSQVLVHTNFGKIKYLHDCEIRTTEANSYKLRLFSINLTHKVYWDRSCKNDPRNENLETIVRAIEDELKPLGLNDLLLEKWRQ